MGQMQACLPFSACRPLDPRHVDAKAASWFRALGFEAFALPM